MSLVAFLFYEKADFGTALPVMRRLRELSQPSVFVKGFDFKEWSGQIEPLTLPPDVDAVDIGGPLDPGEVDPHMCVEALLAGLERYSQPRTPNGLDHVYAALFRGVLERDHLPSLLRRYLRQRVVLERFLRDERPALVVIPEDTDYIRGRLAACVARRWGITSVVLMPWYYNAFVDYPLAGSRLADHFLVANPGCECRLVASGVPRSRISVTGNPAFDRLSRPPVRRQPATRFVYALQGIDGEPELVDLVARAVERHRQCELLIKPHPEVASPWLARRGMAHGRPLRVVDTRTSIERLLGPSTCLVGQTSTALFESLASRAGAIFLHLGPLPLPLAIPPELHVDLVARTREDLERLVGAHVRGEQGLVETAWITPPGSATERATRRVVDILQRSGPYRPAGSHPGR